MIHGDKMVELHWISFRLIMTCHELRIPRVSLEPSRTHELEIPESHGESRLRRRGVGRMINFIPKTCSSVAQRKAASQLGEATWGERSSNSRPLIFRGPRGTNQPNSSSWFEHGKCCFPGVAFLGSSVWCNTFLRLWYPVKLTKWIAGFPAINPYRVVCKDSTELACACCLYMLICPYPPNIIQYPQDGFLHLLFFGYVGPKPPKKP